MFLIFYQTNFVEMLHKLVNIHEKNNHPMEQRAKLGLTEWVQLAFEVVISSW